LKHVCTSNTGETCDKRDSETEKQEEAEGHKSGVLTPICTSGQKCLKSKHDVLVKRKRNIYEQE
jgi:hypothetical protein